MIVYVETNFVLQLALLQEEADAAGPSWSAPGVTS
jgi:hypothetical protein